MTIERIEVGMTVSYRDVNLWSDRGVVEKIGPTAKGGDCLVRWSRSNILSEECLFNLRSWAEPKRTRLEQRFYDRP